MCVCGVCESLTKHPKLLVKESTDESKEESSLPLDVVLLDEAGQQSQRLPEQLEKLPL